VAGRASDIKTVEMMAAEVLATQMSWIVSMDAQWTITWGLLTA